MVGRHPRGPREPGFHVGAVLTRSAPSGMTMTPLDSSCCPRKGLSWQSICKYAPRGGPSGSWAARTSATGSQLNEPCKKLGLACMVTHGAAIRADAGAGCAVAAAVVVRGSVGGRDGAEMVWCDEGNAGGPRRCWRQRCLGMDRHRLTTIGWQRCMRTRAGPCKAARRGLSARECALRRAGAFLDMSGDAPLVGVALSGRAGMPRLEPRRRRGFSHEERSWRAARR